MPIPPFYLFMRPALEQLQDGRPLHHTAIAKVTADLMDLTPDDRNHMLPSGKCTTLSSRVQWALTYLRQALLIEVAGRGVSRITERGKDFLATAPKVIMPASLEVFPEFVAFFQKQGTGSPSGASKPQSAGKLPISDTSGLTPEEAMDAAYRQLREALAADVLDRIKSMPPAFFEQLIVDLMVRLGYGGTSDEPGRALGKTGDGGIDGVINQDKLGLEKIYLQAKRWADTPVGSADIQAFVGALVGQGASKGVFITTSSFTNAAMKFRDKNPTFKVVLIDGHELAKLMIDHDVGVSHVQRFDLKRVDTDYFSLEQ